jgi:hypothetical protein
LLLLLMYLPHWVVNRIVKKAAFLTDTVENL